MQTGYIEVMATRRALTKVFIKGSGAEVGAGDRPWPIPEAAHCFYGGVRDKGGLGDYFKNHDVEFDGFLNAQTFEGIPSISFDFVISGHVIEHLPDPIGAIRETMRVLKPNGVFMLAVPDMRYTHDHQRPPTPLEHLLRDEQDGGAGTLRQAYEEHVIFVHPLSHPPIPAEEIAENVCRILEADMDIHFHAWSGRGFLELLEEIKKRIGFQVEAYVPVQNENIFVLRKN